MASTNDKLVDNYPAIRDTSEKARLKVQHDLIVDAFGGKNIICPLDTTRSNLRILDLGSADGWWLTQVREELSPSAAKTATLIGTDIAPYPDTTENIIIHNFKTPFPDDWRGTFDLIQLRAVLANVPGDDATDLISRAIALLKPGGYIQIVDGAMQHGELKGDEKPSTRFFTTLGNFLMMNGLNADQGSRAATSLRAAGKGTLEDISDRSVDVPVGKNASPEMQETSWQWVRFMTVMPADQMVKAGLLTEEEKQKLVLELLEETKTEGFTFPWYAVWARKVGGS